MLQVGLSWCWIGITAYLWGYAGICILNGKREEDSNSVDLFMLLGICFLTVFAQFFSLFHKIGVVANIILILVDGIIIVAFRRKLYNNLKSYFMYKSNMYRLGIIFVLVMILSNITSGNIYHYDTNLYHAQSIHWIEEYGIVPGLGNLHNRLAYNSSFFCLQALFSFKFLNGESLHSMNGFCVLILLSYAVCSLKTFKNKKLYVSDFLRIGMIYLFCYRENTMSISSSGSDLLALGLVFYVFIKWVSYLEEGIEKADDFAILCLLSVYAISVKLSAAMLVILTIMPAVKLIKNQDWKSIIKYIVAGVVIILPFLIRNVIISGYLIYPYPELDLFNVDWKMPSFTLYYDRYEIQAWGRGLNSVWRFDALMSEWFMQWLTKLSQSMRAFFVATLAFGVGGIIKGIYTGVMHTNWNYLLIVVTGIACFAMWFIGAPLARYGSAFLLIVPLYVAGELICNYANRFSKYIAFIILIVICGNMYTIVDFVIDEHSLNLIESSEYDDIECQAQLLEDEKIYVPVNGDWTGYFDFPATPYVARLNLIELRNNDMNEGFRIKTEYRDKNISTQGTVYDVNVFKETYNEKMQ